MKTEKIVKTLNESDFRIDDKGRVVLESAEIMNEINGASGLFGYAISNGTCANASCH